MTVHCRIGSSEDVGIHGRAQEGLGGADLLCTHGEVMATVPGTICAWSEGLGNGIGPKGRQIRRSVC